MLAGNSSDQELLFKQIQAFHETKAGVKGLVDAGITKIPQMFVHQPVDHGQIAQTEFSIPVVDLSNAAVGMSRHEEVINELRRAAESVGMFQVVNHGIPKRVLEEMLQAIRGFHELPQEVKAEYYSTDPKRKVRFVSNHIGMICSLVWKDSIRCDMNSGDLDPQELPEVCRDMTMEYSEHAHKLSVTLFELLSEGLGLKADHLIGMDCGKYSMVGHYYPPCPEPDLARGTYEHRDPTFLTILLQDNINALQIFHESQWIDVIPEPGALMIIIGDMLRLISNNKYTSSMHRVLAKKEGPRVSVATNFEHSTGRLYEPIKELTSEENPPIYRGTTFTDYKKSHHTKGFFTGVCGLDYLKL